MRADGRTHEPVCTSNRTRRATHGIRTSSERAHEWPTMKSSKQTVQSCLRTPALSEKVLENLRTEN
eukprot:15460252-Alexandrium_andersonii.AAC.1